MKRFISRIFVLIIPFIFLCLLSFHHEPVRYTEFKGRLSGPPQILTVLSSEADLETYMKEYIFSQETSPYDEKYFENNVLLAAYISEPGEGISHEIISVKPHGDELTVTIKRHIPARISTVKGVRVYLMEVDRNTVCGINNYAVSFI